jgi:membrane-associated protease RseP (regulator of RpoE activity)
MNIAFTILLLGVAISLHELGHFVAAKLLKVHVADFSIGFGPGVSIKSKAPNSTTYRLGIILLGGYVTLPENPTGWRGALLAAAGPIFSVIVGIVTLVVIGVIGGNDIIMALDKAVHVLQAGTTSLFSGIALDDLSGPVGIVRSGTSLADQHGALGAFAYFGLINVSVGIFNALPIPPLDGWRVLIGAWIPQRLNTWATVAGAVLLIALFVAVTVKDIFFA